MSLVNLDATKRCVCNTMIESALLSGLYVCRCAATAACAGIQSTRRPDCSAFVPARRISLVGASVGELYVDFLRGRPVGWALWF